MRHSGLAIWLRLLGLAMWLRQYTVFYVAPTRLSSFILTLLVCLTTMAEWLVALVGPGSILLTSKNIFFFFFLLFVGITFGF